MSDRCSDVEAQIQDLVQTILHKFSPQPQSVIWRSPLMASGASEII